MKERLYQSSIMELVLHVFRSDDCGALTLHSDYDYFRTDLNGTDIHCLSSKLHTLYFAENPATHTIPVQVRRTLLS